MLSASLNKTFPSFLETVHFCDHGLCYPIYVLMHYDAKYILLLYKNIVASGIVVSDFFSGYLSCVNWENALSA